MAWSNPPNKQAVFYTSFIFVSGYSIFMFLAKWKITRIGSLIFESIGKHSLTIFLYHHLAIYYAAKSGDLLRMMGNPVIKSIWFISFAVFIPLSISFIKNNAKVILLSSSSREDEHGEHNDGQQVHQS